MPTPRSIVPLLAALVALAAFPASAQWVPQRYALTPAERVELEEGRSHLAQRMDALKRAAETGGASGITERIPDAEIFLDAVSRELRQELFFSARDVAYARECLKEGEARVTALLAGQTPWRFQTGVVDLGYRSRLDGSAQPYQLYVPAGHDFSAHQPERLHIFLHGRNGTGSETAFLSQKSWLRGLFGGDATDELVLTPYGRGNNGWRFGGERDLFEALEAVEQGQAIDTDRIALRGFSMGGHGCWHIGLQHPDVWGVMSPGAGFVDTIQYDHVTRPLAPWQRSLLHLYDPVDYAGNGRNLPVLAYTGEVDPAIDQHRMMMAAMQREKVVVQEYIGPKTAHAYEPETLHELMADLLLVAHRREFAAPHVDFVTYTTRFPDAKWIRVEGLERHWERADVHGVLESPGHVTLTTRNVSALRLIPPKEFLEGKSLSVTVDGTALHLSDVQPGPAKAASAELPSAPVGGVWLHRTGSGWTLGEPHGLRKKPGLQGPIDDALFGPVLAVRPTGSAWSAGMDRWLYQERMRFRDGWDEFFRATLPEKADTEVTRADVSGSNLYLFGDPGSNAVLRRLLPRLPIRWTADEITVDGKSFSTRDHLPMLVFPNPESPERYVVINSGFTFSRDDWHGSNARQFPHLPDYAVIRYNPEQFSDHRWDDVVLAGFFNEQWQYGAEPWTGGPK